jgi:RsiW-degrading membrane proteinase PrsW (M82 family)
VILYATLLACALGAAFLVYRHDLYDREPPWLLALAVGLGAAFMALAGRAESWLLAWSGVTSRAGIAALVSLVEEGFKFAAVVGVALGARKQFNDPLDGLVYGSMSGLGMAVEESVFYLQHGPRRHEVLPVIELARICGHLVMGGIGGFGVGLAAVHRRAWPLTVAGGLGAATGLHFAWDWLAMSVADARELVPRTSLVGVAIMVGGLVLYGTLTAVGSEWSHRLFAPGRPGLLWGWPFDRAGRKI